MVLSIWRYCHLILALTSSFFLIIASITGLVLSFSPIKNELSDYHSNQLSEVYLSSLIENIYKNDKEIIEIKLDENEFIQVRSISNDDNIKSYYANALNGKAIGEIEKESRFFSTFRNIHRSLLLKKSGRLIIGIVSFILFLLSITGTILISKRQLSIKKFYSKVIFDDFYQFWHIINGRTFLLLIVIISLSGTFLSLERFKYISTKKTLNHNINFDEIKLVPKRNYSNFEVFKNIKISEIEYVQFPFSNLIEDHFKIGLKNKEIIVNQFNGEIISSIDFGLLNQLSNLSFNIHTGKGNIIWSLILCISCLSILFFIFSGLKMSIKRLKYKKTNKFKDSESNYLILVGSENGNTYRHAKYLFEIIESNNKKVFMDQLDNYKPNINIKQMIILTSTYGLGQPPSNAKKFIKKFEKNPLKNPFDYTVLGFGSKSYPDFCQFALDVSELLKKYENGNPIMPIKLINNQSQTEFSSWLDQWVKHNNFNTLKYEEDKKVYFEIINKTSSEKDPNNNFTMTLRPLSRILFQSGDLIAFKVDKESDERYYSIAKNIDENIFLGLKKHEKGKCSKYLDNKTIESKIEARIVKNKRFHMPEEFDRLILIGNGTGIAPLLGIAYENFQRKRIDLFWGCKFKNTLKLYSANINELVDDDKLESFNVCYSQEPKTDKKYVQELLETNKELILDYINDKTYVMICGSIAMGNDVIKTLDDLLKNIDKHTMNDLINNDQIKVDTY